MLAGDLDLGQGSNEVTINTDPTKIEGRISGGNAFDLIRLGSNAASLLGLTVQDRSTLESFEDVIRESKGLNGDVAKGTVTSSATARVFDSNANFGSSGSGVDVGMQVQNTTAGKTDQVWVVTAVISDRELLLQEAPADPSADTSAWAWVDGDSYQVKEALDLDTEYSLQLSTNRFLLGVPLKTSGIEGIIGVNDGDVGNVIFPGDSGSADKDLIEGGSGGDFLVGSQYDGTDVKGGGGKDIIVAGSGDENIAGEKGADIYVFSGNWGQDTIDPLFRESAEDTLDFSRVDDSITYILRAGKIYVGTGDAADFDYNTRAFTGATNTVFVAGIQNLGNNIGAIKIGSGPNQPSHTQVFEFGNDWEKTTIEVVDAGSSPNLVLDFSRVYETLRFDFKADGSLVVTQLGGKVDQAKDLIPGKSKSVTITKVDANTKIITGSNENIYRSESAAKFRGELFMTGGAQKIRIPFTERFLDLQSARLQGLVLGDVEHTIDLGQSLGGAAQTAQDFWNDLFPGGDGGRDLAAAGQKILNAVASRINVVSLAGQGGRTPLSFLPDHWFTDSLTGLEYEKFKAVLTEGTVTGSGAGPTLIDANAHFTDGTAHPDPVREGMLVRNTTAGKTNQLWEVTAVTNTGLTLEPSPTNPFTNTAGWSWAAGDTYEVQNGAEIDNVFLNGIALNVAIGDFLTFSDFGDNTFTTKQFQPALNVLAGLTGADTYEFNNFWGLGVVLEVPDLDPGLGAPLPEATDTLSFSGVYGQDVIVDVYDSIAAAGPQFTDLLGVIGIDAAGFLESFTADDGSLISTNVVIARSILPGTDITTSFVVANDIESLIGPSALGTMTVRMHGDANLRGTVAPGAKGDVILDYSQYRRILRHASRDPEYPDRRLRADEPRYRPVLQRDQCG